MRECSEFEKEHRCEQGVRVKELQKQIAAAKLRADEAEEKLQHAAESQEQAKQAALEAKKLAEREVTVAEMISRAAVAQAQVRVAEERAAANEAQAQIAQARAEASDKQARLAEQDAEAVKVHTNDMAGMMREEAAKLHEQIAVLLESAKQAQEKKTLQNAPVAAVQVVEIKQVGSRIELERAAMEREDTQSLCAE